MTHLGFLFVSIAAIAADLPKEKIRLIEQVVSTEMSKHSIPGVSVAILSGPDTRWSAGFGMADLENFVPMTAQAAVRTGSIAKPITAVAVMQLVERGKIDIDAPIQRYVPSFPQKQWPVTVRQLLGHLGGVRHYRDLADFDSTRHYASLTEALSIFRDDPLVVEPGTKFSYTSYGFSLLGSAVESASGKSFPDYIREHILQPAGMTGTGTDNVNAIIPRRARGYRLDRDKRIENCALADTSNKIPGGGLISTAEDLVKFAVAVRDGKLLKPLTVEQMWTAQKLRDGKATQYGCGFFVGEYQGRKRVGHGGGQQGITTNLALFPADGIVIAMMTNLEDARLAEPMNGITRVLLGIQ